MPAIVQILIIIAVALLGYFVPNKYNEYFYREYYEKIISMPLAIVTAIFSALWLIFMDTEGFWYWALLISAILMCIISVIYVIYIGLQLRARAIEIAFAALAQILAIAGIVITILVIIAFIMKASDGKKKKRK